MDFYFGTSRFDLCRDCLSLPKQRAIHTKMEQSSTGEFFPIKVPVGANPGSRDPIRWLPQKAPPRGYIPTSRRPPASRSPRLASGTPWRSDPWAAPANTPAPRHVRRLSSLRCGHALPLPVILLPPRDRVLRVCHPVPISMTRIPPAHRAARPYRPFHPPPPLSEDAHPLAQRVPGRIGFPKPATVGRRSLRGALGVFKRRHWRHEVRHTVDQLIAGILRPRETFSVRVQPFLTPW